MFRLDDIGLVPIVLKHVILKDGNRLWFIGKYFKMVINKLVINCPQVTTVENKTLILLLPYLEDVFLETRTKLRKSSKGILNCCKLQIVFKSHRKLSNVFWFKDHVPLDLVSGVVYVSKVELLLLQWDG